MANTAEWHGPCESRAAFEVVQDESIAQLARFVLTPPMITGNVDHLQHELWEMGKYLPAAFLGLGRYNPDPTSLMVYGDQSPDIAKHDFSKGAFQAKHTSLKGESAYERMVNDWHDADNWANSHRFDVQSMRKTEHQIHAVIWANKALLINYWDFDAERRHCSMGGVDVPDTSRTDNINNVRWTKLRASASNGFHHPEKLYYGAVPFGEQDDRERELAEASVYALAGEAALRALQKHGEAGLYHHLLWADMEQLLTGLYTGPHVRM